MSGARATADELAMIESVVDGIFRDRGTRDPAREVHGAANREFWQTLRENGFTRIGTPEDDGGDGGSLPEAAAVIRAAARWAVPLPLAEAVLVGYPTLADHIVAPAVSDSGSLFLAVLSVADLKPTPGRNLADEPRDSATVGTTVSGESAADISQALADEFRLRGALSRSVLIVGALEALVPLAAHHATTRHQFGRPVSAFQAVQQHVVVAAAEAAAARAAVDAAVRACEDGFASAHACLAVTAAKIRTAQAAGIAAAAVHQVHGAIGMTREHQLHLLTTRLWSWRAEWGGEAAWARELGRMALNADSGLWDLIVNAN